MEIINWNNTGIDILYLPENGWWDWDHGNRLLCYSITKLPCSPCAAFILKPKIKDMQNEKVNESSMYALGLIQGVKVTLLKVYELINKQNPVVGGYMIVEFAKLFELVNEFPTVKENGKFIIEPNEGYPTFEWIEERRAIISEALKPE